MNEFPRGTRLVFDVAGKPDLGSAIIARLKELGHTQRISANVSPSQAENVTLGYYNYAHEKPQIHRGALAADWIMEKDNRDFRLMTLDDLYAAEPEALPDEPGELLRWALEDLNKAEASDQYTVHMDVWHEPWGGACHVCLAGSVMAFSLGVSPDKDITPSMLATKRNNLTLGRQLQALDYFRTGSLSGGLKALGYDISEELLPPTFVVSYSDNRDTFKHQLAVLADWLTRNEYRLNKLRK